MTSNLLFLTMGVVASKLPSLQAVTKPHRLQGKGLQVCCSVQAFMFEHAEGMQDEQLTPGQINLPGGCFAATQHNDQGLTPKPAQCITLTRDSSVTPAWHHHVSMSRATAPHCLKQFAALRAAPLASQQIIQAPAHCLSFGTMHSIASHLSFIQQPVRSPSYLAGLPCRLLLCRPL